MNPGIRSQISDVLNILSSKYKRRRARRRRTGGSNTPILVRPPVLPVRKSQEIVAIETVQEETAGTVPLPESAPAKRNAADGDSRTVAIPQRRSSGSQTVAAIAAPPPDVWQPAEINAAYQRCEQLLKAVSVTIVPVEPVRKGACGMPGPVRLSQLGVTSQVQIKPAATLNCRTVATIHKWIETKVQPAARKIFKSPVTRIRNVSSYACRNRNNAGEGRLSEHALGNALDIAAFELADGRTITVLKDWGPVARDTKPEQSATETVAASASANEAPTAPAVIPASATLEIPIPEFRGPVRRGIRLHRVPDPGGQPAAGTAAQAVAHKSAAAQSRPSLETRFLKQIHKSACGLFGTVLGPEANDAHRDHFHLDTADHRRTAYCR
ncbi:MAG: extensin family protein [Hyphomicrobiaceae bacterium]